MTLAVSHISQMRDTTQARAGFLPRSPWMPAPFLLPAAVTGLSVLLGGQPVLTDLGLLALTAICGVLLINELVHFPRRFGVGGCVLFGGVLLWFCYDYGMHWVGADFDNPNIDIAAQTVARSAFCHCLFVLMMAVGLLLPWGKSAVRLFQLIPEPSNNNFYLFVVCGLFGVGLLPYLLFTAEPFHIAIWKEFTGGRTGGATWSAGRTGNVNTSWGGYIAVLTQLGQIGGQLGVFYAVLVAHDNWKKAIGWGAWLFFVLIAFGSGSRGALVFMALPAVALLYLKHQALASAIFGRFSQRAYLVTGALLVFLLFAVQFQAYFRASSYAGADVRDVSITHLRGTSMFSEGLLGYELIPREVDFFYNRIPGEALVRPIPQTLYTFLIGPIPRVIWKSKPIDPVWSWYNAAVTGSEDGSVGTTVAQGLVGSFYFRYGLIGVIQGGLLMGFLMIIGERALQNAAGRPIVILLSLGFLTWIFRCYRDLNFHGLYPLIIGAVGLWVAIHIHRSLSPPGRPAS